MTETQKQIIEKEIQEQFQTFENYERNLIDLFTVAV